MLGAPGLDGSWAAAVSELVLPGVYFREAYYTPTFDKHQGREVGGLQIHVHDRAAYDPVRTGIALLVTAKQTYKDFAWLPDHYIDHLAGTDQVRHLIDKGASTDDIVSWWQDDLAAFTTLRANYLQYT